MNSLPVLGAAMTLDGLETHRDWVFERQRDLELQDFTDAEVLNGDWSDRAERAKRMLDGYSGRLGIHGPFWGFVIGSRDPEIRAVVAKRLDQGLAVCEAVGATQMVIHSPFTTWSYNNLDNNPGDFDRVIELCRDNMAEAVKRAENAGVTMVIENIEDIDPNHRMTLADSFDSPAVAVSIDTGHAHYAHGSTGAPPVDYYVRIAGDRLKHVHLQDADGYADRHWGIGEGTIRWHGVFSALSAVNSNPRLILELRDKSKIPASAKYLVDLGVAE